MGTVAAKIEKKYWACITRNTHVGRDAEGLLRFLCKLEPISLQDESAVKPDVVNLMAKLEADNDVLESIKEAASQLLAYEKEDSVANDSYFPGKFQGSHTMEIDVGVCWKCTGVGIRSLFLLVWFCCCAVCFAVLS